MNSKQDERRREILAASLQTFSDKGYDKTSMADIVRVTGLSKGTLYWYFKNKQELYLALMEFVIDQFFEEFDGMFEASQAQTPWEALSQMFRAIDDLLSRDPKIGSLTLDFMLQGLHYPEFQAKYGQYYARYIEVLSTIIQRGIDSGEFRPVDARAAAATLIALGDGIMLQALVRDYITLDWEWQISKILQETEKLFMKGLLKEESSDDD